jgi:hypothetical protein
VTQQQLNLLAVISVVVCWAAFAATWLAAENYNESRGPAPKLVPGLRLIGGHRLASS